MHGSNDAYILSQEQCGHDRLPALCEIHDPQTRALLRKTDVGPGKKVAEFGSGLGCVSRWVASQGASVIGVDRSKDHLAQSRHLATEAGLTEVEFRDADIYDHGLTPGSVDIVVCRFILSHLNRRIEAMRKIGEALAPGGLLVCEDPDLTTLYTEPRADAYERILGLMLQAGRLRGADYEFGRRMHTAAREAGFEVMSLDTYQLQFLHGKGKSFWSWTFAECAESLSAVGSLTADEMDGLVKGMKRADDDPATLVGQPRIHQLVARKPAKNREQ